jgi:hypothetical protein
LYWRGPDAPARRKKVNDYALVLDPEAVEPSPARDRFCAACGTKPPGQDCCWFAEETAGAEPEPGALVPLKPWSEWSPEARFLVTVLMELFHGAAEEWELLCRLPWTLGRMSNYTFDAERHGPEAALFYPVMREKDALGRGTRYLVTDLARAGYEAHRREFLGRPGARGPPRLPSAPLEGHRGETATRFLTASRQPRQ